MSSVLLSASFPSRDGRGDAERPYRASDIAAAVAAVTEAVFDLGVGLVFGGHPTITPIVARSAHIYGAFKLITIFQSMEFEPEFPTDLAVLQSRGARVVYTKEEDTLAESVETMRRQMFAHRLDAAFFIGGMSGIEDEYELFLDSHVGAAFLFMAPGGRARRLLGPDVIDHRQSNGPVGPFDGRSYALLGRGYTSLAQDALALVYRDS